jgi:hypothetical protein
VSVQDWFGSAQTALLICIASILGYSFITLRNAIDRGALMLRDVVGNQKQLDANVRRAWERIDAVESRQADVLARLDRLEKRP